MIANHLLNVPMDYQHLPVPVPPMLEQAIGYAPGADHQADFVSFYFGSGDEAYYDDGAINATGNFWSYSLFVDHPKVAPFLVEKPHQGQGQQAEPKTTSKLAQRLIELGLDPAYLTLNRRYNLGYSEEEHTHRLVLDLRTRLVYILPKADAVSLLKRQWTRDGQPPRRLTLAEHDEALSLLWATQQDMPDRTSESLHQPVYMAEITANMKADQELYLEMQEWLNTHDYEPPAPPSRSSDQP